MQHEFSAAFGKRFQQTVCIGISQFGFRLVAAVDDGGQMIFQRPAELMFQDCENVPDAYYSESDISEDLWEYMEKVKDYDKEIVDAILDDGDDEEEEYTGTEVFTGSDKSKPAFEEDDQRTRRFGTDANADKK